jgi:hypothetical protein
MDLDGGVIYNEGRLKGWALKSRLFWALKWQRAQRVGDEVRFEFITNPSTPPHPSLQYNLEIDCDL